MSVSYTHLHGQQTIDEINRKIIEDGLKPTSTVFLTPVSYTHLDVYKRQFFDLDMMDLKALGRFRQKTIKQRTRLKIQLTTYVDQVFPEIQYFFKSGLHQHAVYALLKEAPSPKEIASIIEILTSSLL